MTRLVILDRDGVINQDSENYIRTPDEFVPYAGSLRPIRRLKAAGRTVAIATNQSGIARGYFDLATLNAMHTKLMRELGDVHIDHIEFCPHGPDDACECRKPKPGMLHKILAATQIPAGDAVMIGDSARDIQAARAAGIRPMLVRTGKGEATLQQMQAGDAQLTELLADVSVFADLEAAVADLFAIPVDL